MHSHRPLPRAGFRAGFRVGVIAAVVGGLFGTARAADWDTLQENAPPFHDPKADPMGNRWVVHANVLHQEGNDVPFSDAGLIFIDSSTPNFQPGHAKLTPDGELVMTAMPGRGKDATDYTLTRRVLPGAGGAYVRVVDVLTDTDARPGDRTLNLWYASHTSRPQKSSETFTDPRTNQTLGCVVEDTEGRAVFEVWSAAGAAVKPAFDPKAGLNGIVSGCALAVPHGGTAAVVHVHGAAPTLDAARKLAKSITARTLLDGLPPDVARVVVNVPHEARQRRLAGAGFDLLPASPDVTIVEMMSGERFRGTLADASVTIRGRLGPIDVSAADILALACTSPPWVKHTLITRSGDVLVGRIDARSLHLTLADGRALELPVQHVARVRTPGGRTPAAVPSGTTLPTATVTGTANAAGPSASAAGPTAASHPSIVVPTTAPDVNKTAVAQYPCFFTTRGDNVAIAPPEAIEVRTRYGLLKLSPDQVRAIVFASGGQTVHSIVLSDGSIMAGLVTTDALVLTPRALQSGPLTVPVGDLARLVLTDPGARPPGPTPRMDVTGGDALCGSLQGPITISTEYGDVPCAPGDVVKLTPVEESPGDVAIKLASGLVVRGSPDATEIAVRLGCGITLRLSLATVTNYEIAGQPPAVANNPAPPKPAVNAVIVRLVRELNAGGRRAALAERQLKAMGASAAEPLRQLREQQPAATQKRIDAILQAVQPAPSIEIDGDG